LNSKTHKLRLAQSLSSLYLPSSSINFGAFDAEGQHLFLGDGHEKNFHSWIVAGAFVFRRQPANDLALTFDPRHPV
ncbi:hypothetical protein VYU27_009926, partial [Nannochloropsis oceanica]